MTGPEQRFSSSEVVLLSPVFDGFVSQVLEKLFDGVGVQIRHGQAFFAGSVKQRQEGRKVTKARVPVTNNRGQAEGLSRRFDALGNQLFEGAVAGGGDVVIALTVKRTDVCGPPV